MGRTATIKLITFNSHLIDRMADKVNLDALIPREDFNVKEDPIQFQATQTIQIRDLEKDSFLYNTLRKPDFQRETSDWEPEKVCDFIKSYLSGDLIPAIIFWNSGGFVFVIDGAHRLSALIAWVRDDYGDGSISKAFFEYSIPEEQIAVSEKTRRLIKRDVGTYEDHKYAITNQDKSPGDLVERAKNLASLALQLQWVRGDATKAEVSFFKINQQAAPIGPTELRLLQSRNKPSALAARAIIRSGTGHKYWSSFTDENQEKIENLASDINKVLFSPKLQRPIKTLDLPIAGKGYAPGTLTLILDLVNLVNDVSNETKLGDDDNGDNTIKFLYNTKRIINRISGSHPSSLGLHPAIYFYSPQGRYQSTSFLSIIGLLKTFTNNEDYIKFTRNRRNFEEFILKYKTFVQQVNHKYGSGIKGYRYLQDMYKIILDCLESGIDNEDIIICLKKKYSFLKTDDIFVVEPETKEFSSGTKSAAYLREALKDPMRCKICGGLIHVNSISIDHIIRKEDGGIGSLDNAQLTHPYCNTTYKN